MDLRDHAIENGKEARGNWRAFESFGWRGQPDDADDFAIVYTESRDADSVTRANAKAIAAALAPFIGGPDCMDEHHGHWGVGWVDGYAIRCLDASGEPTPAWLAWCECQLAVEDYPVLDDEILSEIELEDEDEAWRSYASRDFARALIDYGCAYFADAIEDLTDDEAYALYRVLAEPLGVYPEHDGSGVEFSIKRVVTWTKVRNGTIRCAVRKIQRERRAGRVVFADGYKLAFAPKRAA